MQEILELLLLFYETESIKNDSVQKIRKLHIKYIQSCIKLYCYGYQVVSILVF